jgi:hypothetical protein
MRSVAKRQIPAMAKIVLASSFRDALLGAGPGMTVEVLFVLEAITFLRNFPNVKHPATPRKSRPKIVTILFI